MNGVAILGAGMAGLGAAHRLRSEGLRGTIYEKKPYPGGHTASFADESGFLFDDGPHISFTKDQRIQDLFANSVKGEYEVLQARVNNHWRGHRIKHPAQCNLHGLPVELVADILRDFVEASRAPEQPVANYEEWLHAAYGRTFAETFPMHYGLKYHTTAAANMSTDWLGPRLYRPEVEEVIRGALSPETPEVHYVDHFRYPTRNGFAAYLVGFLDAADLCLGREVSGIDPRARTLTFADGTVAGYDRLISSLPLPELVGIVAGVPDDVVAAASRLSCTQCVTVNLGVDREDLSDHHWTYFYDDDVVLTRLSFPHLFSPNNVPAGTSSLQAEIYRSEKYLPLEQPPEMFIDPVIADLQRTGFLRETDEIVFREARLVPYANVIFDLERADSVERIRGFLDEVGIASCGRYGEWGYHWTDESFKSGEHAAERVLGGSSSAPPPSAPEGTS